MSKGLEAVKRLKWGYDVTHEERIYLCECIEKELKEYESRRAVIDNVKKGFIVFTPRDTWEEERKKLKALETIKEKQVNIKLFFETIELEGNAEMYNKYVSFQEWRYLTQEEYDLLKEVLL